MADCPRRLRQPGVAMVEVHVARPGLSSWRDSMWMAGPLVATDDERVILNWDGVTVEVSRAEVIELRRFHWQPVPGRPAWQEKVYDDG